MKIWVVTDAEERYVATYSDPQAAEMSARNHLKWKVRRDAVLDAPKQRLPEFFWAEEGDVVGTKEMVAKINQIIHYLEVRDG